MTSNHPDGLGSEQTDVKSSVEGQILGLSDNSLHLPEIRSEIYREVIGAPPPFAVHSGALVATLIAFVLLIIFGVVPYPITISSSAELISVPMPVTLTADASGRIAHLSASDGQTVANGQLVALVGDDADYQQISALRGWLNSMPIAIGPDSILPPPPTINPLALGSCEAAFASASQAFADYQNFRKSAPLVHQLNQLKSEFIAYQGMIELLKRKEEATEAAQSAAADLSRGQQKLVQDGLASPSYSDADKEEFESEREQEINSEIAMSSNNVSMIQTESDFDALLASDQTRQQQIVDELAKGLNTLRQAISSWEMLHIIRSPESGTLRMLSFWANDQDITVGQHFALVEPKQTQVIGVAYLPSLDFGSVHINNDALISLYAYPTAQYGMLKGRVSAISSVSLDGKYRVLITLPDGLQTSRHTNLGFTQYMSGTVRIKVRSISVLHRLFLGLTGGL